MALPQKSDWPPLLLGIDVGSSRTKTMLVDAVTGDEVGAGVADSPFVTTGDRTEASVEELIDVVRRVVAGLGAERLRRVVGGGVAGVAECGAPFDTQGRALAPVIAWHDRRGEAVADHLSDRFGPDLDRAIGQHLRYVSTVAKLGWLLDDGLAAVPARWLGVPEIVLRALTGVEATEWSLAARTGCFDVGRREWLPDVAAAAGFGVEVFPGVMGAGQVMGRVTEDAAAWSGVPAGVPLTIGGHDHLVGFVGSGAAADELVDSVGTAETVVGRSPTLPDVDVALARSMAVTLFPGGDGWAVIASAVRSGQAVDDAAATLGRTPAELDRLVTGGSGRVLDAPGLLDSLRRREPPALPDGSPADVWATLLDTLATETAAAVDRITGLLGPRRRLLVFGGGSVSEPWQAAKERRIAMAVERSPMADAVARGAALLGGVAAGFPPV
ncbi:MAG TPA: FGGY family carbohydrate kinase [Acidimicrobiales bacterium]|nr:FGGY family carbohydrate kinase [Acidimicrobiales bacterium]